MTDVRPVLFSRLLYSWVLIVGPISPIVHIGVASDHSPCTLITFVMMVVRIHVSQYILLGDLHTQQDLVV